MPPTDEGVSSGTLPGPAAPDGEPGPTESGSAPGQPGTDGVDGPAQSEPGTLPSTGADLAGMLGGVAALLAAGVVALLWRQRMVVSRHD
ncbi:hypothetical protein V2J52_16465 [Georgenia sp. MJ173]|uniref:hypothetical protein n=1 Tax=Georgenia sunbinii TaxID=3117728 RepID=UPI002F26B580